MTNLETKLFQILTARPLRPYGFSCSAQANADGSHTELLSMVLQRRRPQGRTGHMIKRITFYSWLINTFYTLKKLTFVLLFSKRELFFIWNTSTILKILFLRTCVNMNNNYYNYSAHWIRHGITGTLGKDDEIRLRWKWRWDEIR